MFQHRRDIRTRTGRGGLLDPRPSVRLRLFAIVLTVALVCVAVSVKGDEEAGGASVGLRIHRHFRIRHRICLDPPYQIPGGDRLLADPIAVSVASNVPRWGLEVTISVPGGRTAAMLPAATFCRLRDGAGVVVDETPVGNGLASLDGNGRCGTHEVFLELVDGSTGAIVTRPHGLVLDILGSEESTE